MKLFLKLFAAIIFMVASSSSFAQTANLWIDTNGGTCSLLYDSVTYTGYIEDLKSIEKSADDPEGAGYSGKDFARYEISVVFVEGVQIGGSA